MDLRRDADSKSIPPAATRRPRPGRLTACGLSAALLALWTLPLVATVEVLPPIEETPPTTQDLNGVAVAPNGDYVIVGDGPTVLHRAADGKGNPIWTSLDAWAAGFFSAEIFTVQRSPVVYPAGDAWVIGGRETLVESDFSETLVVDQRPGSGALFTPVLATEDVIWYGVPDLGIAPSFLHRYDRLTQTAPGIAFTLGAVLAMCELENGNLRYVTTAGDIEEVDEFLQVTSIYDQDDGNPLELNAASFSGDCEVIAAGDATSLSRVYAGFIEAIPPPSWQLDGPAGSPWRFVDRPGEPIVTAPCFLKPREQASVEALYTVVLRCEDATIETGDDATMSAFADLIESRIAKVSSFNRDEKCMRAGAQAPEVQQRLGGGLMLPNTADFEMLTVGINGRVQRLRGSRALFFDTFETGDLSQWPVMVP
ncbi:MAG: hypothetical protein AAF657_25255 [Acidobacteriota bacterium]